MSSWVIKKVNAMIGWYAAFALTFWSTIDSTINFVSDGEYRYPQCCVKKHQAGTLNRVLHTELEQVHCIASVWDELSIDTHWFTAMATALLCLCMDQDCMCHLLYLSLDSLTWQEKVILGWSVDQCSTHVNFLQEWMLLVLVKHHMSANQSLEEKIRL